MDTGHLAGRADALFRRTREPGDAAIVRCAALLRLALAIAAAAVGSYLGGLGGRSVAAFVVLGLLWVPWAGIVMFASDRPSSRLAQWGGPYGDVVILGVVQALVPGTGRGLLFAHFVVVAFAAYTAGRLVAGPLAALSVLLVLAASQFGSASEAPDGVTVAAYGVGVVAVVLLLERAVAIQMRASAHSTRLEGKAGAILARVADGVVVTDGKGRILQCNPAAGRMVGTAAEEMIGGTCAEVLGLRIGERRLDCSTGCALLRLGDPEEAALGHETWRWDQSERRQPLLANAEAVLDDEGRRVEVVHSLRDVTRLKQAEEAKTLFLATASHELKTPLTVIKGFTETLLSFPDIPEEHRTKGLEAVARRADELSRIVDRLLLSSRIEAGRAEVHIDRVAPGPLVEERADALWAATGRRINVELDDDLPDVAADPHGLVTVIDHLLENALKYSPNGAPVTVMARREGEGACIEVQDGGIGMDAEQAARCFDKFWQAESTDVRRFGGTGIGLYIVRSIVEAMGGRVEVRSTHGSGTTFTVILAGALPLRTGADDRGMGEQTSIREFMRQLGVPERAGT